MRSLHCGGLVSLSHGPGTVNLYSQFIPTTPTVALLGMQAKDPNPSTFNRCLTPASYNLAEVHYTEE